MTLCQTKWRLNLQQYYYRLFEISTCKTWRRIFVTREQVPADHSRRLLVSMRLERYLKHMPTQFFSAITSKYFLNLRSPHDNDCLEIFNALKIQLVA